MSETDEVLVIDSELIINNVSSLKKIVLSGISKKSGLKLDLSKVTKIDISGLQLLISIAREAKNSDFNLEFQGDIKEELLQEINRISFAPSEISDSNDLLTFIKETV